MPKSRPKQRAVFSECFDGADRLAQTSRDTSDFQAAESAARHEPPLKAIILYGSGFISPINGRANLEQKCFSNLDTVVREGLQALLMMRHSPKTTAVSELEEILGHYTVSLNISHP
ncbi:hypothetical protein CEUSTIGMA_g2560.t1 [Chlamydomonas eustigma]|uniref:Uncharacterized protein n=1 Tax=Chlamydomonas eustigma TaxID=1157962 RepID=A0A250WWH7_9CHLO|nr:hypothetical protein CEUSTIGMA_g2560.t1 [Chlamydomonas eustigma]|eukprot:GAX75116.1 hypothetical protein CEUSTIGMA_g2560.t1 [Chlamydomonas eustigma]